jgi:DNA-binding transcriptional LysR family regulator
VTSPFETERDARFFLAVVDEGGVTAAAATLFVAQPSLSQAVRVLERRTGRDLFERTPRGTVPTAAGRALVPVARAVLERAGAGREAVADVVAVRAGTLRLVAHASVAADPLAAAVGEFRRRHPGVDVVVEDARDDDALVRRLAAGDVDLALVHLPLPEHPALVVRELGRQHVHAAFPPGTDLPPGPVTLDDLRAHPLVALLHGGSARRAVRDALEAAGQVAAGSSWHARVSTPRVGAAIPLVLAGAGVALVGDWYEADRTRRTGRSASGARACSKSCNRAGPVQAPFTVRSVVRVRTSSQMRGRPSYPGRTLSM